MRYLINIIELDIYYACQSPYRFFFLIFKTFLMLLTTYTLQLLIHEAGHLIFGLLTGYRFSSFRMFNIALIKKDGKISIRLYPSKGSVGQCLMLPPKHIKEKKPYILYNLGGIILDIITSLIFISIAISSYKISNNIRIFSLLIGYYGFGSALINGLPISLFKNNDGNNTISFSKYKSSLNSYYLLLDLLGDLQDGKTYSELSYEKIKLESNQDLTLPLVGYQKIWECYYFMDNYNWIKAKECLTTLEPYINKLSKDIVETIDLELFFLSIVTGESLSKINELYQKVITIINNNKKDIDVLRIKMANEIYQNNIGTATLKQKRKDIFNNLSNKYQYLGKSKFNKKMLQFVIKMRGC